MLWADTWAIVYLSKLQFLGLLVPIIFEVTQSLEGLCVQGCGFLPSKEVCMKHAPGLFSQLGLVGIFSRAATLR